MIGRRVLAWSLAWLGAGAFYLLLIDTTELSELLVGIAAAIIAATGFELAREQRVVGETVRASWVLKLYRPLLRVPRDIWFLSVAAVVQLVRRRQMVGTFRVVPFGDGGDDSLARGRRAMAETFGSFAPNTIIVGVDGERGLALAHQLRRGGGREDIDPLELG